MLRHTVPAALSFPATGSPEVRALTLLILELRVPQLSPEADGGQLFAALIGLWPSFLAFILSFFVVLGGGYVYARQRGALEWR